MNSDFNTIVGTVYNDNDQDCVQSAAEKGLGGIIIKAEPGPFYTVTDTNGNYSIRTGSGNYQVSQVFPDSNLVSQTCPAGAIPVSFSGTQDQVSNVNFANKVKECSLLSVQVTSNRKRRCFTGYTTVTYKNAGTVEATNATIKIILPPTVAALSSTRTWDKKTDSLLVYNIARIAPGEVSSFVIKDSVLCGNEDFRGMTACTRVTISPIGNCNTEYTAPPAAWDKSSIKVTGWCNNGMVNMVIKNGGSGDMLGDHEYRIFANDTLISRNFFSLRSGDSLHITISSLGQTIRLEADQHRLHPGKSRPREIIEACVGSSTQNTRISKGFVTTVPTDDMDEFVDIDCMEITDSYDPNDKQVSHTGVAVKFFSYGDRFS